MTGSDPLSSMGFVPRPTTDPQADRGETAVRGAEPGGRAAEAAGRAAEAAQAAARAARVLVRDVVELDGLNDVMELFAAIWGRDANPPVTIELLRAFTKAGNYVGGAYEGDRIVGACVGFFHAPDEDAMHSHIAGVSGTSTGHSVGFALKLHQRAWALRRGVSEIAWTFDPLVSRNAYFNLAKLGAQADEYLPDFYGQMRDVINGADDSDRLLVRWPLLSPIVERACAGTAVEVVASRELAHGAAVAVGMGDDGLPVAGPLDAPTSLVAVPHDIAALRAGDPAVAHEWRAAVRVALTALTLDGGRVEGFDRSGWYVIRRNP